MKLFRKKTIKPEMVFEGKYVVKKNLGHGGMGDVWLVRHNEMKKDLALKILNPDIARKKSGKIIERFFREAQLAARIQHPNLITVHDVGKSRETGYYYIIMDYVPGGSLRDLLKKERRIPPDRAVRIIKQMASALAAADANHMVHRDIKPDNIMFDADGTAKLADLGIAKSTDEQDPGLTIDDSAQNPGGTRPRPQFGTPAYMSPEQAHDSSQVDIRADIYSLGVVFYEMLTGRQPFYGTTRRIILSQVMGPQPVPDIKLVAPDIPPDLVSLISEMTSKDMEKRIANPEILLQKLNAIRLPVQTKTSSAFPSPMPGSARPDVTGVTRVTEFSSSDASEVTGGTEVTSVTGVTEFEDVSVSAPAPQPVDAPPVAPSPVPAPQPQSAPQPAPQLTPQPTPQPVASQPAPPVPAPVLPPKAAPTVSPVPAKQKEEDHSGKPQKRKSRVLLIVMAFLLLFIFGSVSSVVVKAVISRNEQPATPPKNDPGSKPGQSVEKPEGGNSVVRPIIKQKPPLIPDPLEKHQIVLLADESDYTRAAKKALTQEFGAENVSWQEAKGMGGYKSQIDEIVKSDPSIVILCFSEDFIKGINNYGNFIQGHAHEYFRKGIPFVFIMMQAEEDDARMRAVNTCMRDESQRWGSVPFSGDMLSSDSFPAMIREVRKK